MAPTVSCTWADASASRSCTPDDILRMRLPKVNPTTNTGGTIHSINNVICQLCSNSMTMPPTNITTSRMAIDSSLPTMFWMVAVSAAKRPVSSPEGRS